MTWSQLQGVPTVIADIQACSLGVPILAAGLVWQSLPADRRDGNPNRRRAEAMEALKTTSVTRLKERTLQEFKVFCVSALYLWLFLGSFTVYRRLVLAETGITYLHYGIALIEALIIAKVILIGRMFGFSRRFEDKPLIVPVLYKSIVFGVFVLLFGILEHLIEGWVHGQGLLAGLHDIGGIGADELGARVLMLIVSFVPFFAFWEIGRVIGMPKLAAMFFSKREAPGAAQRPAL